MWQQLGTALLIGVVATSPAGAASPIPGLLLAASYASATPSTVTLITVSPGVQALNNLTTGARIRFEVQAPIGEVALYAVRVLVSNGNWTPPPALHLEVDGVVVSASIPVGSTGGWSSYVWVSAPVPVVLAAGPHALVVVADQQYFNLQAVEVVLLGPTYQ